MLKSHIQSMIFILTLLLLLIYYLFYYYYSSDKVVENFIFIFDGQTLARFQFYCVVLNSPEPNNCSVHKNSAQELQVLSRPMVLKQRTDILCIPESACRTIYLDYLPLIRLIKWNVPWFDTLCSAGDARISGVWLDIRLSVKWHRQNVGMENSQTFVLGFRRTTWIICLHEWLGRRPCASSAQVTITLVFCKSVCPTQGKAKELFEIFL